MVLCTRRCIICTVWQKPTDQTHIPFTHYLLYTRHILMARDFLFCCHDVENNWNVVDGTWNIQFHTGWKKGNMCGLLLLLYRCQLLLSLSLLAIFVCSWFVKTNRNDIAPSRKQNVQTCNTKRAFVLPILVQHLQQQQQQQRVRVLVVAVAFYGNAVESSIRRLCVINVR